MGRYVVEALFDSNILIDCLNGVDDSRTLLKQFRVRYVSVVTYIEVLVGAKTPLDETRIRNFFKPFQVCSITAGVIEKTIVIRRSDKKIKLPDGIILATAEDLGVKLYTRDCRDFLVENPLVVIPYQL